MKYYGFKRPSFGIKTIGWADLTKAKLSPLVLFANGEQGVWFDPSDLSTLFQDSAGTVPVTKDGDPVGLMLDKSGNDNHATQTIAAKRPIYRTDGNLHWLEFDGVDDFLTVVDGMRGVHSTGELTTYISYTSGHPYARIAVIDIYRTLFDIRYENSNRIKFSPLFTPITLDISSSNEAVLTESFASMVKDKAYFRVGESYSTRNDLSSSSYFSALRTEGDFYISSTSDYQFYHILGRFYGLIMCTRELSRHEADNLRAVMRLKAGITL